MATAVFGVSLAYVRLDRFHYRNMIRNHAQSKLEDFRDEHKILELMKPMNTLNVLKHLAQSSRYGVIESDRNFADSLPWFYRRIISSGYDRKLAWIGVYFSLATIVIGTFQRLGIFHWPINIGIGLAIIVTALLILMVVLFHAGDWILQKMTRIVDHNANEVSKQMDIHTAESSSEDEFSEINDFERLLRDSDDLQL